MQNMANIRVLLGDRAPLVPKHTCRFRLTVPILECGLPPDSNPLVTSVLWDFKASKGIRLYAVSIYETG